MFFLDFGVRIWMSDVFGYEPLFVFVSGLFRCIALEQLILLVIFLEYIGYFLLLYREFEERFVAFTQERVCFE